MESIFTLIKVERKKQEVSQADLAFACGTSSAYISNLENGRIDARWSTIKKVLDHLNIKIFPDGYLFNI